MAKRHEVARFYVPDPAPRPRPKRWVWRPRVAEPRGPGIRLPRVDVGVVGALVITGVLACALGLLLPVLHHLAAQDHVAHCKNNLKQLGLGLILYRDNQGRGTKYPAHDGADMLVKLWESGVTQEPELFLCPATDDDNENGALLRVGSVPPFACSYAARRNHSQAQYPGVSGYSGCYETVMASDDLEGPVLFNHGESVVVLFVDGHVEELQVDNPKIVTTGFGEGGFLDPLAN